MSVDLQTSRSRSLPAGNRDFLSGGGDAGAYMRAFDWTTTPLGEPESWPQSLKTVVRVMLDSRYAMWMMWGPDRTFFCNDAYLPTVGIKRNWVIGARSDKVWEEVWETIESRMGRVFDHGEATWDEGLLLFLERSGFAEETYHTFSYSPVYDDNNRIAGMLCVVTEVTERVIGERRLRIMRDLATQSGSQNLDDSCEQLCAVLSNYPLDVGFAAFYLFDTDARSARRVACTAAHVESYLPLALSSNDGAPWPLAALRKTETAQLIEDLPAQDIRIATQPWPDLVRGALMLPLKDSGQDGLVGFTIIGISPRRPFDSDYRAFFELIASQTSSALAEAQASAIERKRLEALAELDRAKTAFFSNVSHEFRTPLALMLGPIEEMLIDGQTPPAMRESLELAHRNSLRLLKLVNSLLDFSRIEAGRAQAQYEPTDLAALTRDLASTFRSAIERANLGFDVDCDDLDAPVYVDRDMWEKIVLNLLSNAFKFTLDGAITVRLHRDGDRVVLDIIDSGVGVPAHELPRLFERFHRVENARGRTHEGSGIGLALVHELVKLHGGSIDVRSEPDAGTHFRIALPFGADHLPPDRIGTTPAVALAPNHSRSFVEEAIRWLPDASKQPAPLPRMVPDHRFVATFGARIVLADDNADMRAYVRDLLAPQYDVEAVADGAQALAAAQKQRPQLILTDVMMPQLDGFGLLQALRADESLRDIPVILLSARAGEEARIEGLDAGADDYLAKPFSSRELLARVGALLELTQMRRENEERLQLALTSIQDQFFVLDENWRFTLLNQRAIATTGRSVHELLGRSFFEIYPQVRATAFEAELIATTTTRQPRRFEFFNEARNRWVENSFYPAASGVAVLVTDITERKRSQDALRLRTAQFETLLKKAPLGVYLIDSDFRLREVNPIARTVFGNIDGLIGRDFNEVVHILWQPEFADDIVRRFRHTLTTGEPFIEPEVTEWRRDIDVSQVYEWQIHRIPLPDGNFGVVAYFRDISAHVAARAELIAQQRRLEEADRQKDQFLAMLAHELRNPLAPIRNASELLTQILPSDSDARPAVGMVKRQVEQLTRLVDDLLDMSRITQGRIELKLAPVDMAKVIAQALETVESLFRDKQQRVAVVSNYLQPLHVRGDFARLVQCVVNILTNASKYTDVGGEIRVQTQVDANTAIIDITDNGAGIAPDLLPHLFDLFVQGDRTLDRSQGGLGIELSVVKGLIGMHGGEVIARSEGLGRGSSFSLRLPLIAPVPKSSHAASSRKSPPRRILIVDDNVDAANSLAALLALDGHTLQTAYSGRQALQILDTFTPDIAFLDIGLPEMNGYELAGLIRAREDTVALRLVALTGYGQTDDRDRAFAAGFDQHLVKPVEFAALRQAIVDGGGSGSA